MAAIGQISTGMTVDRTLSSSRIIGVASSPSPHRTLIGIAGRSGIAHRQLSLSVRSINTNEDSRKVKVYADNGAFDLVSNIFSFDVSCFSRSVLPNVVNPVPLGFEFYRWIGFDYFCWGSL